MIFTAEQYVAGFGKPMVRAIKKLTFRTLHFRSTIVVRCVA